MRLTDLVRDEKGGHRKRKSTPAVTGAFANEQQPVQQGQNDAVTKPSGFLQADDLSAIYDLSSNPQPVREAPQPVQPPPAPMFPEAQLQQPITPQMQQPQAQQSDPDLWITDAKAAVQLPHSKVFNHSV